jgi:diguanylate cyclase (GGDEF)-like protein
VNRIADFIQTRVSRRLFMLFVLAAFLPLTAIAVLSLTQVQGLLLKQGEQRLTAIAKSYAMTLFERLLLAAEVGVSAATSPQASLSGDSLALRTFESLGVLTETGKIKTVIGRPEARFLSSEARSRLARGKPVIVVMDETASPRIFIATPLPRPSKDVAFGEIKPEHLWGSSDESPAVTEYCVVEDRSKAMLYCSSPMGEGGFRAVAMASSTGVGHAIWERNGESHRMRAWSQFMRAGFGTPDWIVVASQPERFYLEQANKFTRLYIPVVFVALFLVTWFTVRQSRSIVAPLTLLAAHARRIAANDFGSRLALERKDEFGDLATAFDQMSERLGRQFDSLKALAEIDRLILSTQDTAHVIRAVLQRLDNLVPADVVTITLFDHENPDYGRTYFRDWESDQGASMVRSEVSVRDRIAFREDPQSKWVAIASGHPVPGYLSYLQKRGMAGAFVQPITWRGEVCGALALGYHTPSASTEDQKQQARELADRVAVAVSSAWRDERLYLQAHFDALTGLPNRLLFKDRLTREIIRSEREKLRFALVFIDLDHFKTVNDSFGHSIGDDVLREAARRIARCVREADTVARLGGDEFTVLLTSLDHPQEAWLLAESIVASLSHEFTIGEQRCFLSASAGIASYPADAGSTEELLKSADTAMYRAKAAGRAQVVFFEEKMNAEAVARLTLDRDLRMAIDRGELVLHYQPQVDLATGAIHGAEALLRWNHPEHGLVSPLRFIPLAEESGFIEHVGQWTLKEACRQMREWRLAGLPLERVGVNVSPRQFRKRATLDFIAQCLAESQLPSSCLELEITEGLLMDHGEAVEGVLRELADAGHEIALDDFGTGFSSMSYLKRFPVHTIKIDRVFIDGLDRSLDSEAIVAAIIAMSHALGKIVTAEGVETAEQLRVLRRLDCDQIQGFLISPALPAEQFERLLRARVDHLAAA